MDSSPLDARTGRHLISLLFIAFAVRFAVLLYFQTYAVSGPEAWGYETGRISRSLVEGKGFSSPFAAETGPTAWFPPVHPTIQAGVFKVLGVQSVASAFMMRMFNIICDVATCFVIFSLASRLWGTTFGLICGWVWAFFPDALWIDTTLVSYASISLLLLLCALYLSLRFDPERTQHWILQGGLWGAIALTNPTLLSLLPICWLFTSLRTRDHRQAIKLWLLSSAILLAIVAPWTARNYVRLGDLIPVRGNFGHELYKGNHWGASGENEYFLSPEDNPKELQEFIRMGERAYVREHKEVAMRFIHDNPSGFFRLTRRRIFLFWSMPKLGGMFGSAAASWNRAQYFFLSCAGLAGLLVVLFRSAKFRTRLSRPDPNWLFAIVVILYPIPYYLTFPNARYRYLIEPILVIYLVHLLTGFRFLRLSSTRGAAA